LSVSTRSIRTRARQEAGCPDQEAGGGGLLIGQDLAEGDPGAIIDGRVEVVIAAAPPPAGSRPAVGAMAATIWDPAQLLDVDVDQLAGMLTLVAHHRAAGPVDAGQAVQAVAAQHPIDGGAGHAQVVAESMGPWRRRRRAASTRWTWLVVSAWGYRWGRELRSASPAGPCWR
jgi:hypothetical protein